MDSIKIDAYDEELEKAQRKFPTDSSTQWSEFELPARTGRSEQKRAPEINREVWVMAWKEDSQEANSAAADRVAGVYVTPPQQRAPHPPQLPLQRPHQEPGRPQAPASPPARGANSLYYDCGLVGNKKNASPYKRAAQPARGGRGQDVKGAPQPPRPAALPDPFNQPYVQQPSYGSDPPPPYPYSTDLGPIIEEAPLPYFRYWCLDPK